MAISSQGHKRGRTERLLENRKGVKTMDAVCAECLWYYEESDLAMTRFHGFCRKQDKRTEPTSAACDSLRAWHTPEHVLLFNQESMLFPTK